METTESHGGAGADPTKPTETAAVTDQAKSASQAAKPKAKKPEKSADQTAAVTDAAALDSLKMRRRFVWASFALFMSAWFVAFLRFFFPRTIFEPSTMFRIGYPSDFPLGVDERFKQSHRIWVVRQPDKLFVIYAKCTHLGCTPNWIESENKYKCPCHGSGYDIGGINYEGPAPRPMDRAHVELDAEGQIVVDTNRLYMCPPGMECEFENPNMNSFLVV